jgi:hypothetical protein
VHESRLLKGSAHETEKIVRLGVPRIIQRKENAPEFDHSSFYGTTGTGVRWSEATLSGLQNPIQLPSGVVQHPPLLCQSETVVEVLMVVDDWKLAGASSAKAATKSADDSEGFASFICIHLISIAGHLLTKNRLIWAEHCSRPRIE